MFDTYRINVKKALNKDFSHNPEDAEKIVNEIKCNISNKRKIEINFRGIKTVNTAFCNIIYESLKNEVAKDVEIKLINCNSFILETFNRVKDNYNSKVMNNDLQ